MRDFGSPSEGAALASLPAPIPVLVNGAAGLDRAGIGERISRAMEDAAIPVQVEEMPGDAIAARLRRGRQEGWPIVAVAGGDGTLLTAATELAGGETALSPVPTGTLNHFSRRLGIPDLPAAAEALRERSIVEMPLGVVDERVFLNTATFGFYADVVRRRERYRPWLTKWPAAAAAFARTLPRLPAMRVTLLVDGERLERRTTLVWVGVGWGSFPFVHESRERRENPDLEIVILRPTSAFHTLALAARLMVRIRKGELPVRDRGVEVLHTRQLLIQGHRRIGVTLDGEVMRLVPPVFIAVQDGALRVVAPAPRNVHDAD